MKLKLTLSLVALCLQQVFVFAQTNPLFKYLPANASMVMSFNSQRLGSKVSGEIFRQSFMYRELMKDPDSPANLMLSSPAETGIDLSSDLFLVSVYDTTQGHFKNDIHIFGLLKKEGLFTTFIKNLFKKDSVQVYGTNKIIFKETSSVAWNNEIFVFSSGSEHNNMMSEVLSDSTSSQKEIDSKLMKLKGKLMKAKRELSFSLLTPHTGNFFSTDSHFISLMSTPADIKMWNSGAPNPTMNKMNPFAGLMKMQSLTGTNKTSVINFENGKIVMQSHNYLTENVASVYKKYPPSTLSTDLVRRLPKGNLLVLINTSYNPEMGKELMQKNGLKEMMDSLKNILPFDFSLLSTAFKNNMMLAVVRADEVAAGDSISRKMGGIQVFLAMPIGNKAKFEELKISASNAWDSLKNTESFGKMMKGFRPVIRYNDDLCVLSLSPDAAASFLNNPGKGQIPEWLQSYTQHPMVMSINMRELFAMMMGKKSGGRQGISAEDQKKMLDIFDRIIAYGGDYENESLNTSIEFQFTDQNKNALTQLFDMINTIAEKEQKTNAQPNEDIKKEKVIIDEKKDKKLPPPQPKKKPTSTKQKVKTN
jgi:hypothetical protein